MIISVFALMLVSCTFDSPKPTTLPTQSLAQTRSPQDECAQANIRVKARVTSVVSPDTIKVVFDADRTGNPYTVRYRNVTGPRPDHYFYQESFQENRRLVEAETLDLSNCEVRLTDGIILADVYLRGKHINADLVSGGYVFGAYSDQDGNWASSPFNELQNMASDRAKGLWHQFCADVTRYGGENIVDRAFRNTPNGWSVLLTPAGQRLASAMKESFKYAWVFYALRQEQNGQLLGTPEQYYNEIFIKRFQDGNFGSASMLTQPELAELRNLASSGQTCGGVFLNAPQNSKFLERIKSGTGARAVNAETERFRSQLNELTRPLR